MFGNLIFLILILFIVSMAPSATPELFQLSPFEAFIDGMILYALVILMIVSLNWILHRLRIHRDGALQVAVSLLLIGFLAVYHFVFVSHRLYLETALVQQVQVLFGLFSLFLYFFGLGIHHYTTLRLEEPGSRALSYAIMQLRFLGPFILPYFIFQSGRDLLRLLPDSFITQGTGNELFDGLIAFAGTLSFLACLMIFLPAVIQKIWGCKPLPDGPLHDRLNALCQRAGFRHAGMKTWTVMNHALSAAIIGVVPRFRYVMFTESLLEELTPTEIEAVLAHEIGHSRHRHLIIYPFIILGMMLTAGTFFLFMQDSLTHFFALEEALGNGALTNALQPFFIFVPYALILGIYFRLVFGFFSRQFERQADLNPIEVGMQAEDIINALNRVGQLSGESHDKPNWHHFSLRQRMDFLAEAAVYPAIIPTHHRRVKRYLRIYFAALVTLAVVFFSPFVAKVPVFGQVYAGVSTVSTSISEVVNAPRRARLVRQYLKKYRPQGNPDSIVKSFDSALMKYEAIKVPGVFEFYAAQHLLAVGEYPSAVKLMTAAWKTFDFAQASDEVPEHFRIITHNILRASQRDPALLSARLALFEAMRRAGNGVPESLSHPTFQMPLGTS